MDVYIENPWSFQFVMQTFTRGPPAAIPWPDYSGFRHTRSIFKPISSGRVSSCHENSSNISKNLSGTIELAITRNLNKNRTLPTLTDIRIHDICSLEKSGTELRTGIKYHGWGTSWDWLVSQLKNHPRCLAKLPDQDHQRSWPQLTRLDGSSHYTC